MVKDSSLAIASLTSQSRLSLGESEVDLPSAIRSEPVGLTSRSPVQNGAVTQSTPLLTEQFLRSEFNQQDSMNLQVTCHFMNNKNQKNLVSSERATRIMVSKIRE